MRLLQEQLIDTDTADIFRLRLQRRQNHQRHDRGPRPIRNLVDMKRRPHRQQHDLDRQHRRAPPFQHPEHRQQEAGENVAVDGAATRPDRLARARHVRRAGRIADHLQREIGFHAGAHVKGAIMHQRPAAMRPLRPAQILGDLGFERSVDRLAEVMTQQNIFGPDAAVGFQLEHPMSIRLLAVEQCPRCIGNACLQSITAIRSYGLVAGKHVLDILSHGATPPFRNSSIIARPFANEGHSQRHDSKCRCPT